MLKRKIYLSHLSQKGGASCLIEKAKLAVTILLFVIIVVVASFALIEPAANIDDDSDSCYIGVAFCGNTTVEAKLLIDRVKNYINLFIIQSGPVSINKTSLDEICEYAIASELNIIVFFGDLDPRIIADDVNKSWRSSWIDSAKSRLGDNLLGIYYYDEPGGMWLDTVSSPTGVTIQNMSYDSVANGFINSIQQDKGTIQLKNNSLPMFVSDYALFWYDYLAGYDVVFAEVAWNHSLTQDIALLRGAANMQSKDWGAIIGWTYDQWPYLASGEEIYNQMVTCYEAGAKYITIFNYPQLPSNPYGVMQDEHFEALEKFWVDVAKDRITHNSITADTVLVLPKDYGWGMRRLDDRLWGFWGPDEKSPIIWAQSQKLLAQYSYSLDIIYDDPQFPVANKYSRVYLWNVTEPING